MTIKSPYVGLLALVLSCRGPCWGWGSVRLGIFETDFCFPRMATLTPPFPCFHLQYILNISNSNYYPITVTQLTIEVLHVSLVVGQVSNSLLLHVGPLASKQVTPASPARGCVNVCGGGKGTAGVGANPSVHLVDRCFMQ